LNTIHSQNSDIPQNVIFVKNKFIANVVKMRTYWSRVGPKSKKAGVLKEKIQTHTKGNKSWQDGGRN
jgi:hypothetical protein